MLKIGEFAGLTGLTVKALRHYDDTGVLTPDVVDARSGYRLYREGQVRAGVMIRALRDAGVPLPEVSLAVAGGDARQTLDRHRMRVLEQREREDRAVRAADGVLRALAAPIAVSERVMPAQHYVGRIIPVPVDDAVALTDEQATAVFGALYTRLRAAGVEPSGPFWMSMRAGDRGIVEVVGCWPTSSEVPEHVRGDDAFAAVLPARSELVATWRPVDDEELPEGSSHPAVVGLFDAIAERGIEIRDAEIRQTVLGLGVEDHAVELSVTIR